MANALWWLWNDGVWWLGLWFVIGLLSLGVWVTIVTALRDEYGVFPAME
jgi:hypothetical protein